MKGFFALSFLALALPALSAPVVSVKKYNGPVKADSYIVKLKEGANRESHLTSLKSKVSAQAGSTSVIGHTYDHVFNGYSATLRGAALQHVLNSPDVEYVEEDGIATVVWEERDNTKLVGRDVSEFKRAACGSGVEVIGIDTGIRTTHTTFAGRASWGATFGGYANADGNGHGTHTAGTAVGNTYGVATQATIVAVKVLSDSGSGAFSDVISGINWAVSRKNSTGKPTIATMSLGGGATQSVDDAVSSGISQGVYFTIAAGNSNVDASTTTPARVAAAITVGAVDSSNRKASFSNYGSVVDIQAPGVNILSAWSTSDTATNIISGTSMATPYVAGIVACAISSHGNVGPAQMALDLRSHGAAVVTGEPSGTTNLLAQLW